MIDRNLSPLLRSRAAAMPAVAVTGPRQSGKTTLCRATFAEHAYVSLEPLDVREFARADPRGFLAEHSGPSIFDEVQRAPDLFSYLQEEIDRDPTPGRFILTGSQQFGLSAGISQSLAGRVARLSLLPLSLDEVGRFDGAPETLWRTVWAGGYPRIFDRKLDPAVWLGDYVATYVQRDVRQVLNVADLDAFTTVLRLAAGRTAQQMNLSRLGADAGVTHNTARAWISVLETSGLAFRLPRWHRNLRKRAVKAPKLHFVDTGVVCHLLGIRDPDQLRNHPLRGPIFETWVASEILKSRVHRGLTPDLFHLREDRGLEIDILAGVGTEVRAVEVKSAATVASDFFKHLVSFREAVSGMDLDATYHLIYGGNDVQSRGEIEVTPWDRIQDVAW